MRGQPLDPPHGSEMVAWCGLAVEYIEPNMTVMKKKTKKKHSLQFINTLVLLRLF